MSKISLWHITPYVQFAEDKFINLNTLWIIQVMTEANHSRSVNNDSKIPNRIDLHVNGGKNKLLLTTYYVSYINTSLSTFLKKCKR